MNELELTGRVRTHVIDLEIPRCGLHYEVVAAFLSMRDAAASAGISLQPRSSFRDLNAQLSIWNAKWRGERTLYDRAGQPLQYQELQPPALLDAILAWSALPGGSRHHWGSDLDVIDADAVPAGYTVQLLPSEYAPDGIFGRVSAWLDDNMHRYGFFRPYRSDRGGVSPEPWHLSYAPVSMPALESLSLSMLRDVVESVVIEGREQILLRLPEIYTRYLLAIDMPEGKVRW